jgi:2'-5' RNA ligase
MHRLFVAIRLPRNLRAILLNTMGGVSHARWQSDEQLHLTLRFLGEVDHHTAEDVAAALGTVHHPRFSLALDGLGHFERGRIETLWVGVAPHPPLITLQKKISEALRRVGIPPEGRAYLPHITIARFGRNAGSLDTIALAAGGLSSPPAETTEFCLYESELSPGGSSYTIVARYPLA